MSGDMSDLKGLIGRVASGQRLSAGEAEQAFDIIMSGNATPAQMGGFLMALRVRGEQVEEIVGAARAMRGKMLVLDAPPGAVDTCGTGGDAKGTYNVSTCAAFIVAACGVPVAKHGNRALSSKAGAADVLTGLGVNIDADMSLVQKALFDVGITFLMAPRHHSAMRHVGPTRVELGTRTIFNLLGPLSNPCRVKRQVLGVFAAEWVEPLAHVLKDLGHERAWVVHGAGGLDELSTLGPSQVAELKDGKVTRFELKPEDLGLARAKIEDIQGGDGEVNAKALRAVLQGQKGSFRDIALLTAGAALLVAGKASDIKQGIALAGQALDSGKALEKLDALVRLTNSKAEVTA
jgi:anthranilate phosphoribosyltransferase